MGIDQDEVEKILDDHGERIQKLEVDSEVMKEKWNNISTQLTRIENNALSSNNALLASNNSMLQTMNKLVEGNTIRNSNRRDVILKILGILGGIITAITAIYFAAKGINANIPTF